MDVLDVHFSKRKWKQIFREIDINFDDKVTFEEFFLFLFPEHDVGVVGTIDFRYIFYFIVMKIRQALEKRRLKLLGDRVRQRADHHQDMLTYRYG